MTQEPKPKRKSRYKRDPHAFPDFTPQEQDVLIIQAVHSHRFLDSDHIETLFPTNPFYLRRQLQKLYHTGYLDRKQSQRWGRSIIYALGQRGAELLEDLYKEPIAKLDWREKNRTATPLFYNHILMIADFLTTLEVATELKPNIKLKRWTIDQSELKTQFQHGGEKLTIIPDAQFTLQTPKGNLAYFLEADRGTMTLDRFLKKLQTYFAWWQLWDKESHEENNYYEKTYYSKRFRLLTLTRTEERKTNLLEISKNADPRQEGFRGFWFATIHDFNKQEPLTILNKIWQNPRDPHQKFSLLD